MQRLELIAIALFACSGSHAAAPPPVAPSQAAPSPAASPPAGPARYDDATRSIDARAGDRFVVALPANMTTPMEWRLDAPDATVVALVDRAYTESPPPGCGPNCVGYGGTDAFTFAAQAPGATTLRFSYAHVGKSDAPPERSLAIEVRVVAR